MADGSDDEDWFEEGLGSEKEEAEPQQESDDLFEESFADALEGAPGAEGGEEAGFGGPPTSEESFDEAEFESDIPRIELGVEGLDAMIQGGVPERSLMVGIGGPGTGKTTFGLQFLNEALENGESAVFIALEEDRERVLSTAEERGWGFRDHVAEGNLAVVDLDPIEMANSLASIRTELPALIDDFGATRLVLDSVSLLEMMYDDQASRRTEIYDFTRSLKQAGVTTFLTSEADADNPYATRFGIIEYLTDAVFVFRYVRPEDFHETRLAVEIQKIRDANHSRETKPYEISEEGLEVYRQATIF
ncbi:MAG: KaiC domain-containing protein [Halobacteriaceae archaeon]